ncbi:MAG: hypothetical protein IPJ65_08240 [Archangiaceae bacterium]|nr:hypothetical protein [Archangiaceae bacterium]
MAALASACGNRPLTVDAGPFDAGSDAWRVIAAPYDTAAFTQVRIGSLQTDEHFHTATAPLELKDGPYAQATLTVDLTSSCYPFEGWAANPPPSGQRWPADCDAFDRNFELVLDPGGQDGGTPGIELVRAITPFGGPLHFDVDVTDVMNGLRPGLHPLSVTIPTYSDAAGMVSGSRGGWFVSARLRLVPGLPPRPVLAVIPLVDRNDTTGMEPAVSFTLPPGVASTRLEYRVTGHGGANDPACFGPAEEFCQREHQLFADESSLDTFTPWRNDCDQLCTLTPFPTGFATGTYCLENPCGAVQSVRAPRANWCPGSVTLPVLEDSTRWHSAGPHTFRYRVITVKPGGVWRVSAVLIAYGS